MTSPGSGGRGSSSKIRWSASRSVVENASQGLPELAQAFFAAGDKLSAGEAPPQALHQFRLLTKRFRYALELFSPCYGSGLDRRIEALRVLQQHLGDINDCATTRDLVLGRSDLPRSQRDMLVRRVEELSARRIAGFRQCWRGDFAPPRRQQWWTNYLRRYAGHRTRS